MKDLRTLPEAVLARLKEAGTDRAAYLREGRIAEAAPFRVELRRSAGGDPIIEGYATVYDHPYEVAGGPPYGWTETIVGGAASKSIAARDDVRLLVNHDGITLARTKAKTLELKSDDTGLFVSASLDERSPTVQSLVSSMTRGDMDEMSFAFRALRQEWNEDYTERRILEVKLYDVSVVTYPANPATVVQVQNRFNTPSSEGRMISVANANAMADALRMAAPIP